MIAVTVAKRNHKFIGHAPDGKDGKAMCETAGKEFERSLIRQDLWNPGTETVDAGRNRNSLLRK
ncbi:MAG: hypothetical protein Fues2KO_01710 [Fuerstiella sp.]